LLEFAAVDAVSNPYSPGAGLRPTVLVGRDDELAAFAAVLERAELDRPVRGVMVTGLRGVGKTVLLHQFADQAAERDWMIVEAEVQPRGDRAFLAVLVRSLTVAVRRTAGRRLGDLAHRALASIEAFSLTVDPSGGLGVGIEVDARGSGDLDSDFAMLALDVSRRAKEMGVGVAVFVDELQEMDRPTMAALAGAAHVTSQRAMPFVVVGAGLPNLPARLADARSYAERLFDYHSLGPLPPRLAADALAGPAAREGVAWERGALDLTIKESGGYPYFLQEFGSQIWSVAEVSPITRRDARVGVRLGLARLDGGFFRARWDRATPAERRYLQAMVVDGAGPSRTQEIAARLGKVHSSVGPTRAGLIGKGLIFSPEYGFVAFTVPGMAEFVRRHTEPEEES
jgi:AAA ATPase domain